MIPLSERLAGAPISWGVCEVPGWGAMLPPSRVLSDMRRLGLRATELGPVGYLGPDPGSIREAVATHGLATVGGFVPLVLHDTNQWPRTREACERSCHLISGAGGGLFVSAAIADPDWGPPPLLSGAGWKSLAGGLELVEEICRSHGLEHVLHPHAGTLVQSAGDVEEVLERSAVRLCLDTGHLAIGGVDPLRFARDWSGRVGLVHLKDVRRSVADAMRTADISLREATRAGLFCPLGSGDLPVADAVAEMERSGYGGWYVLEQDTVIEAGVDAALIHPEEDVKTSIDYLRPLLEPTRSGDQPGSAT